MKNPLKNKIVFFLLFSSMAIFQVIGMNRPVGEEKISANSNTTETINEENIKPRIEENVIVTRENFLEHFTLSGNAIYNKDTGIVTLTNDVSNQVGSFTLNKQIDLESSFQLNGRVNLGNKVGHPGSMTGGDGMGFGFHSGGVSEIGHRGNGMGMAGLPNAFGFKLDTYFNTADEAAIMAAADPAQVLAGNSFGAFVYTDMARGYLTSEIPGLQLIPNPTNNQFVNFELNYDTTEDKVTVVFGTQIWEKDISTWHDGIEALSFIVSASTGGATNLQQFEFETIEYTPESFNGLPVKQDDVIVGEDLSKRNLHSFVTDVRYAGVLLSPEEYTVTLDKASNDMAGDSIATVVVRHEALGVGTKIDVPITVSLGETLLFNYQYTNGVGAFTYHPTENRITANQGIVNLNNFVHPQFFDQEFYSIDLYRLTSDNQKIEEATNYLTHSVTGEMSPTEAISQFADGTGSISTEINDIIKVRQAQGSILYYGEGYRSVFLPVDADLNGFLELTQTGYRRLLFNLLEASKESRTIDENMTNTELDELIPSLLNQNGHESVEIIGFSQYPNRESLGESIGKILVQEPLSNGVSYVQHEYEFLFNVISTAIPVTGVEVTPKVVEMVIGDNIGLTEMVIPSNATNNAVRWESSNLAIASVSTEGVVTGLSPGTVTISVFTEDGNRTDSSEITVIDDGVLKFSQFAESLNFRDIILGNQEVISSRENEGPLVTVTDTRWNKDPYSIQVTLERELSRPNGSIVPGALFFLNSLGESQTLSQTSLEVFNHFPQQSGSGDIERMEIEWEEDEGILLRMPPEEMVITDFSGSIRWNLVSGPF
ncbi:MAG: Ig-like domain-containing protein [Vagococcus sp.]|uniref:lectin-like domain-containing protein n=1 Tax=Vagococcus sp. TaxID=1933889 RepID=UPI002FC852A2